MGGEVEAGCGQSIIERMMGNANQFGLQNNPPADADRAIRDKSESLPLFRPLELAELPAVLPSALEFVPPSRAVLVTDQIRSAISRQAAEDLVLLVSERCEALAIVLIGEQTDMATVLHAGPVRPTASPSLFSVQADKAELPEAELGKAESAKAQRGGKLTVGKQPAESRFSNSRLARGLGRTLGQICADRGIEFLQWATSWPEESSAGDSLDKGWPGVWPEEMGFTKAGDLEYLAMDFDTSCDAMTPPEGVPRKQLEVRQVNVEDSMEMAELSDLVQATYRGSMDCPALEQFRTAAQIIDGYQSVPTYAPDLWMTFHETSANRTSANRDKDSFPIGCLLMARHLGDTPSDPSVLELVYMGVVPEARGRGFSADLLAVAQQCCRRESASRLILAVDKNNGPARDAYFRLPMKLVLRETVWVRNTTR